MSWLDCIFGEFKWYRKLSNKTWYYIRTKDMGYGIWGWTTILCKGDYIIYKNYKSNNKDILIGEYYN